ncbi:oxidoreductase HTATIP2-like isoform X2 [Liolophura sinensis]|uniref:oxidoreductase HTATIP2-like isoform X2 n=1 Tax=Liolophura sinensis TaxID=3198878 RepID=UPI00315944DC
MDLEMNHHIRVYKDVENVPISQDFQMTYNGLSLMAEAAESNLEEYKKKNMNAFVVGYTGEVGKALVKHLAQVKPFQKVYLLGRREVTLDVEDPSYFEQKSVDFEKLEESSDLFKGIGVGFCALGTTKAKAGAKGFVQVDHDFVVKTAEVAKAAGCEHFNLVSSQGADKNSSFLYTKTKGQAEEAIKAMAYQRYSIFRPGVLLCDRQESRAGESFVRFLLKPVAALFPTAISTPVDVLVKAMINNVIATPDKAKDFELYENKAIHMLGGNLKSSCSEKTKVDSAPEK